MNYTLYIENLEKEEVKRKLKSRRKELIKIKTENNELQHKIKKWGRLRNKSKSWFFGGKKISKMDKPLAKLTAK